MALTDHERPVNRTTSQDFTYHRNPGYFARGIPADRGWRHPPVPACVCRGAKEGEGMSIKGIHHVQIACPAGTEDLLRGFYGDLRGMPEIPKPAALAVRGGWWFAAGMKRTTRPSGGGVCARRQGAPSLRRRRHRRPRRGPRRARLLGGVLGQAHSGGAPIPHRGPVGNRVEFQIEHPQAVRSATGGTFGPVGGPAATERLLTRSRNRSFKHNRLVIPALVRRMAMHTTMDKLISWTGLVVAAVLLVAGGLLTSATTRRRQREAAADVAAHHHAGPAAYPEGQPSTSSRTPVSPWRTASRPRPTPTTTSWST